MDRKHYYILLMAGGSGTRLFPASRNNKPKHLSKIIDTTTLYQQTYNRAVKIVPVKNIFVSTNTRYVNEILKQSPGLTKNQILAEPEIRNTGPAFTLGSMLISKKDPEAIISVFSCDHKVRKENNFVNSLKKGFNFISKNKDKILTLVLTPTVPHLGYEYVEQGKLVADHFFTVGRFIERPPTKEAAQKYVNAGYFWNASYYVFTAKSFLEEVKKFLPEVFEISKKIADNPKILNTEFLKFPEVQIDKSVMTKTTKLVSLSADWGWTDIGSWETVTEQIPESEKDADGNFSDGNFVGVDTHNTLIFSKSPQKLIATIGLNNITIISTDDVILIMERGRGQEVKKVVEEIKNRKLNKFL